MATERQINANRRNARRSTGPKSPEGRAAVRLNALTHGLTAEQVVISTEDPNEFNDHLEAYLNEYKPQGVHEHTLVYEMAVAQWRLRRCRLIETGYFDMQLQRNGKYAEEAHGEDLSPALRLAFVIQGGWANTLSAMSRYESRLERSFYRALHELQKSQDRRAAAAPPHEPDILPAPSSSAKASDAPPPASSENPHPFIPDTTTLGDPPLGDPPLTPAPPG